MRKRAKGESSAVFANFHVGGECMFLAYRYHDYRNNRVIIFVLRSIVVMAGDENGSSGGGGGGAGRV